MTSLWENQRNGDLCAGAGAHSRSLHCAPPDFLWGLVALANFLRLSLLKAAHVPAGECRSRKSGYAPVGMTSRGW
jgi:hypothetical protein